MSIELSIGSGLTGISLNSRSDMNRDKTDKYRSPIENERPWRIFKEVIEANVKFLEKKGGFIVKYYYIKDSLL